MSERVGQRAVCGGVVRGMNGLNWHPARKQHMAHRNVAGSPNLIGETRNGPLAWLFINCYCCCTPFFVIPVVVWKYPPIVVGRRY